MYDVQAYCLASVFFFGDPIYSFLDGGTFFFSLDLKLSSRCPTAFPSPLNEVNMEVKRHSGVQIRRMPIK